MLKELNKDYKEIKDSNIAETVRCIVYLIVSIFMVPMLILTFLLFLMVEYDLRVSAYALFFGTTVMYTVLTYVVVYHTKWIAVLFHKDLISKSKEQAEY